MSSYARSCTGPPAEAWQQIYDYDVDDNLVYEGWARSNTATSAPGWTILKRTYVGNNLITEQWAHGDTNDSNVWDDRAALTYA
jgi:hypothetical protein